MKRKETFKKLVKKMQHLEKSQLGKLKGGFIEADNPCCINYGDCSGSSNGTCTNHDTCFA